MRQCGQNSTLNHTSHRFFAHSICNYRHIASFARFHLTTVSQHDHHASVQINGQMVLLDQLGCMLKGATACCLCPTVCYLLRNAPPGV